MGTWHHQLYKAGKSNRVLRLAHIWVGRLLIFAGFINGGLGVDLAANSGYQVYGSVAGIMGVLYIGLIVASYISGREKGVETGVPSRDGSDSEESGEAPEAIQITEKEEK
jgi:hypothetical protein